MVGVLERVLCSRLVGRDEELFALEDALLAAHGGESRLVALGGEAGIGKTRLASELAKRARRLGWTVQWGACSASELPIPYLPVVEALGNYLSSQDTARVSETLGAARRELAQLFPQLGIDEPDGGGPPIQLSDPGSLDQDAARTGLAACPQRVCACVKPIEHGGESRAAVDRSLQHLLVAAIVVVVGRTDLDLDAEQL
jgi:hypothetical protein